MTAHDKGRVAPAADAPTIFYAPNTCALAVLIALEEAEVAYKVETIDFERDQQHSPDYLALNPKGRVPALVVADGVLTEVPALLTWIGQAHAPHLLPQGVFALARMQAFCSYLCATVHVAHAHGPRGYRWADTEEAIADMKRKLPQSVTAAFAVIEDELGPGAWVMGQQYTVADGYLFTLAQWLETDGADIGRLPRVLAHRERMRRRPAVQRAMRHD